MTDDFSLELKRIDFDFEESLVFVKGLKSLDPIDIDGINIRLVENQSTRVPLWVADILVREGYASYDDDADINYRTLAQLAHEEAKQKKLAHLPTKLFIKRAKFEIERLSKEHNKVALRKLASIEGSFNKIIKRRMKKLIQEAILASDEIKNQPNVLAEEEWLLNNLRRLLQSWQEALNLPEFQVD